MDPATAISLFGIACSIAKGAFHVGKALYKFKNDVKGFDSKSEAFVNEIKALGAACEVASQRLEAIIEDYEHTEDGKRIAGGHSEQLWTCLENQIIACQQTVQGLQSAHDDSIKSDGVSTTWERVLKQVILYLKVFDINEARERVKSHTTSLQIVLLSVGIEISYLVPRRVDQRLQAQLAELTDMKDELSKLLNKRTNDLTDDDNNEAAILVATSQVIRSGETLYSGSTAGESTLGGVDPFKERNIVGWLADAQDIERDQEMSGQNTGRHPVLSPHKPADSFIDDSDLPDHLSAGRPGRSSEAPPVKQIDEADNSDGEVDFDSDNEVEFAMHCMDDGRAAFDQKNYASANAMLQEALKVVLELPINQRKMCDTDEVCYMLAHCAFHLQDAASAKSALLAVLETGSSAVPHAQRQIYDTSHMLSQACVKLGELEQARSNCRSAMRGRQKLLGKSHELVHESTALMARILELQGNVTRAGFFRTMIPETHKHLIAQFKELNIEVLDQRHTSPSALQPSSQQSQPVPEQVGLLPDALLEDESLHIERVPNAAPPLTHVPSLGCGVDNTSMTEFRSVTVRVVLPRSYTFRIPQLQEWADRKGYGELGPLSPGQRKAQLLEQKLIPESRIERALAAADDEEALRLSKARSKLKPFMSHMRFSLVRELRLAVLFAVTPVVKALIEKGVSLDAADSAGWTMLHYAALSGSVSTAELLVKEGASVPAAEQKGNMSPLSIALKHDYLDICDLLYQNKANPLREFHWQIGTPIHLACAKDILPLVRSWSSGGLETITSVVHIVAPGLLNREYRKLEADFSKTSEIEPRVVMRMTISPIGAAALMGSIGVMNWAISKGLMSLELGQLGDTEYGEGQPVCALALAAAAGQTRMVQLLRDMEINTRQADNSTEALKMAVLNKMEETACWLLSAGVRADEEIVVWAEKYGLKKFTHIANLDKEPRVAVNRSSPIFPI